MGEYVVTGVTGQVGEAAAIALAARHRVVGVARFGDETARARLTAAGVECRTADLAGGNLDGVPTGVDALVNFAVSTSQRWESDLTTNAQAAGLLMAHVRPRRMLHCSTTGVYRPAGAERLQEDAPLGDNHLPIMPTYSISKIAGEQVVATMCRHLRVPTTIARLNVPYGVGPDGAPRGWPAFHLAMMEAGLDIPVHPDRPNLFDPIDLRDIAATVEPLVAAATVPATVVNWAGPDQVDLEEWCRVLAELTGLTARFVETEDTIGGVTVDTTRLRDLGATTSVRWPDGFEDLARAWTAQR